MAYVVTARWVAREGEQAAVLEAIERLILPSRSEPGFRFYQPNRDPTDDRVFFFFEIYDDEAAYAAHGTSDHFQRHAIADAIPRLESRERAFYLTIDA